MDKVFTNIGDIKFYYLVDDAESLGTISNLGPADIKVLDYKLHRDPTLENAVLISIGSDARALDSDTLPQGVKNRRGWWGSILLGFELGSRAWLLERAKISNNTLALYKQYILDSLQWMIDDEIVKSIEASTVRNGNTRIDSNCIMQRENKPSVYFKYYLNWQYQLGEL